VRVSDWAGTGVAKATLSFDTWKQGNVASTVVDLPVVPVEPSATAAPPGLRATLEGHGTKAVWALAFAPDGRRLAVATVDGLIKLWDVQTWKEQANWNAGDGTSIYSIVFSNDGQTLFTGHILQKARPQAQQDKTAVITEFTGEVRLWDVQTGKLGASWKLPHDGGATQLHLSSDGAALAVTEVWAKDGSPVRETQVALCDPATGRVQGSLPPGTGGALFCPDGKTLVSFGEQVKIWDRLTGKELAVLPGSKGESIHALALSPDGQTLAGTVYRGKVLVWDLPTHTLRGTFRPDRDESRLMGMAISPDGRTLAVAVIQPSRAERPDDMPRQQIVLRAVADLRLQATVTTPAGFVAGLTFSPDGRTLASSGIGSVWLWDLTRFGFLGPAERRAR
jgi:WD40 repeat protein